MEKKITKRELIMDAALTLFAEKGYDGVSVDEIGDAVGMKGPALYHYFKGKEDLLDKLMDAVEERYVLQFGSAQKAGKMPERIEELAEMSMERLNFTIHDSQIKKVRKVMAMEQFRNDRIRTLTTLHQFTGLNEMNAVFFRHLIAIGAVKPYDPELLAFEFTTPVSLLIQLIDREPEREAEVMELIRRHMEHFIQAYKA